MHRTLLLVLLALALAAPAAAQDGPYLYATYLECDPAAVGDADAARASTLDPALNAHVAAGDISSWGWIAHHTGGHWNRASYFLAPTLDALLTFQDAWQTEVGRNHAAARDALRRACPAHEDYIWRQVVSSGAPGDVARSRPPAAYSVYFTCSRTGLGRADALVREAFAPILNGLVEEGAIAAWRWHGHVLGGPYTRLLVLDGATHAAVVGAMNLFGDRLEEQQSSASEQFDGICGSHQDYLWTVTSGSR